MDGHSIPALLQLVLRRRHILVVPNQMRHDTFADERLEACAEPPTHHLH